MIYVFCFFFFSLSFSPNRKTFESHGKCCMHSEKNAHISWFYWLNKARGLSLFRFIAYFSEWDNRFSFSFFFFFFFSSLVRCCSTVCSGSLSLWLFTYLSCTMCAYSSPFFLFGPRIVRIAVDHHCEIVCLRMDFYCFNVVSGSATTKNGKWEAFKEPLHFP